jgi:hypothetical protein
MNGGLREGAILISIFHERHTVQMNEPDSRTKAAAYVPWIPLVVTGCIGAVIAFSRSGADGTSIALGVLAVLIAVVGIVGMARVWRRRH